VSRIAGRFKDLADSGRKALIPYFVAGDPTAESTVPFMHKLVEAGADILEIGIAFSDPMSEGPVIQLSHERALANGASLSKTLACVREFREHDDQTPVLLMGYANPVEHMGFAVFADAASSAGVDAVLTVDIPPEEVARINKELHRVGMDNIFLIAPNTPEERIARIAEQASGFLYYVSLKGVTGAGHLDTAQVNAKAQLIRSHTRLPLAVGFGIKDAETARAVAQVADGVVVGSALVDAMAQAIASGASADDAMNAAAMLVGEIRQGIDGLTS
jgi:tryptophan synthase alpha chain